MMRGPRHWSVAVRKPHGDQQVARSIDPLEGTEPAASSSAASSPGESLAIGFRALLPRTSPPPKAAEGDEEPQEIGRWASSSSSRSRSGSR